MKLHCIITLLLITVISEAKVRNGYANKINEYRASYDHLQSVIASPETSQASKDHARRAIVLLEDWIKQHDITANLLQQFRITAPAIYDTMDTVTDASGRNVDVFVKFVSVDELPAKAHGTTNVDRGEDPSSYTSEYGPNTISIKIAIVRRSLYILAHEFGHAYYQIKNIATYYDLYVRLYKKRSGVMGHSGDDAGGRMAEQFEKQFMKIKGIQAS